MISSCTAGVGGGDQVAIASERLESRGIEGLEQASEVVQLRSQLSELLPGQSLFEAWLKFPTLELAMKSYCYAPPGL
jgi:hypothetical protein